MKFCPECGQENREAAKRCLACGKDLPVLDLTPKSEPLVSRLNNNVELLAWAFAVLLGVVLFMAFIAWFIHEIEIIKTKFGW